MSEDCFGPVPDFKKRKHGECVNCFDTNWAHDHHQYFEGRQQMICKFCRRRFKRVANLPVASKANRIRRELWIRATEAGRSPEYLQGLLPEYCAAITQD